MLLNQITEKVVAFIQDVATQSELNTISQFDSLDEKQIKFINQLTNKQFLPKDFQLNEFKSNLINIIKRVVSNDEYQDLIEKQSQCLLEAIRLPDSHNQITPYLSKKLPALLQTENKIERMDIVFQNEWNGLPSNSEFSYYLHPNTVFPDNGDDFDYEFDCCETVYDSNSPFLSIMTGQELSLDKLIYGNWDKDNLAHEYLTSLIKNQPSDLDNDVAYFVNMKHIDIVTMEILQSFYDLNNIKSQLYVDVTNVQGFALKNHNGVYQNEYMLENPMEVWLPIEAIRVSTLNKFNMELDLQDISSDFIFHKTNDNNDSIYFNLHTDIMDWDTLWEELDNIDVYRSNYLNSNKLDSKIEDFLWDYEPSSHPNFY